MIRSSLSRQGNNHNLLKEDFLSRNQDMKLTLFLRSRVYVHKMFPSTLENIKIPGNPALNPYSWVYIENSPCQPNILSKSRVCEDIFSVQAHNLSQGTKITGNGIKYLDDLCRRLE